MSENLLSQLAKMSIVVADTGDIESIGRFTPRDATTNPSLIAAAAKMPEYASIVDEALAWARKDLGQDAADGDVVSLAVDRLAVEFGLRILSIVPGRVSTEVDARLSWDTEATVARARKLIEQYEKSGTSKERILIKIASTWEGIRAAEILEAEGIHCNLTLLFGIHQAVASAEAKVTLISPFVGRILDWYKKETGRESYPPAEDPGVQSVTKIYQYFKHHGCDTEIMGASFRNAGEILELAGCDLLTISPGLLAELEGTEGTLERKLDPDKAAKELVEKINVDEASFRALHEADRMAKEKTDEGIESFSKALIALEAQLTERLAAL